MSCEAQYDLRNAIALNRIIEKSASASVAPPDDGPALVFVGNICASLSPAHDIGANGQAVGSIIAFTAGQKNSENLFSIFFAFSGRNSEIVYEARI